MNEHDDTGNAEKLPLNELARLGLLAAETELPLWEILDLEFPTKSSQQRGEYAAWREAIESALRRGLLTSRLETFTVCGEPGYLPGVDWITRESYRQWRAQWPVNRLPDLSHIQAWLGAMPTTEPIPPVETHLPGLVEILPQIETSPPESPATPESISPSQPVPLPVPVPVLNGGADLPKKRQRIDAIRNAIRAAIAVLSPSGGALPRTHELFEHLAHNDATKTIIGVAKGNRALLWIDDNDNEQCLTFPALTARLRRWKG